MIGEGGTAEVFGPLVGSLLINVRDADEVEVLCLMECGRVHAEDIGADTDHCEAHHF